MTANSGPTSSSTPNPRNVIKSTPGATAKSLPANPAKPQGAAPSHAAIATKAYEIWLAQGKEPGCDQKYWFEAEQQLLQLDLSRAQSREWRQGADDAQGLN